jgi:hypothetical protein
MLRRFICLGGGVTWHFSWVEKWFHRLYFLLVGGDACEWGRKNGVALMLLYLRWIECMVLAIEFFSHNQFAPLGI